MLTKTCTVLTHRASDATSVQFGRIGEDLSRRTLLMERDAWEEMGRPETVTITIEPGNMLDDSSKD